MIDQDYLSAMAAYGAAMNRRLLRAAAGLDDAERRRDRGAFWHSISGTLSHLLWADTSWMSRLDGWTPPRRALAESWLEYPDFEAMRSLRDHADRRLQAWAASVDAAWLAETQEWFSQADNRRRTAPRQLVVMHLFNHATHHRGQIHAMLTAAGCATGDTDLPIVLGEDDPARGGGGPAAG